MSNLKERLQQIKDEVSIQYDKQDWKDYENNLSFWQEAEQNVFSAETLVFVEQ